MTQVMKVDHIIITNILAIKLLNTRNYIYIFFLRNVNLINK